jgi:hypothetical protein
MTNVREQRAMVLYPDEIDRTPPNLGMILVVSSPRGWAFRCLACNAGTGVGAYDGPSTRRAARWHLDECPHRDAHHVTTVVMATQALGITIPARRRRDAYDSVTYPVVSCTCGWKVWEDGDRESGRRRARYHRDTEHARWFSGGTGPA